jgi:hypothetical protein
MDLAVCTAMIQTLGPGKRNQFSPGLQGSCQTEIIERSVVSSNAGESKHLLISDVKMDLTTNGISTV